MKKIFTIILLLCSLGTFSQTIYYVKPTGSDAATSPYTWANAFKTLQKALEKAVYGDQIWVAQGTFYPDEKDAVNSDLRTASFVLKAGVKIYGGFAGTETQLSQRNIQTNVTTLSGDVDGTPATNTGNSYHVVRSASLNSYAVLDGFTIMGGNADGTDPGSMLNGMGGGLLNEASSPLITHCTFTGNTVAFLGGGLLNYNGSSPTITYCTFTGNKGGGITNGLGYPGSSLPPEVPNAPCNPTISHCTFTASAVGTDFGIVNFLSAPTVTDCSFTGSTVNPSIGIGNFSASPTVSNCSFTQLTTGIANDMASAADGPSSPTITHCTFTGNTGTGISNASATPTITYCTFTGNTATTSNNGFGAGAAILIGPSNSTSTPSSATITHCSFTNNTAEGMGGAILSSNSSATLINCRFSGNSAQVGGAIATSGTSALNTLTLTNCTFYGNTATAAGGAILKGSLIIQIPLPLPFPLPVNDASTLTVSNSILWGNSAPADAQITTSSTTLPVITYSLVQGGTTDNHNLNTDPQFKDAASGDLHLALGSPAIDAGDNTKLPQSIITDLDSNPRYYNSRVDMGAYEFLPGGAAGGVIYVKHDATGQNDGTSWADAFTSLQDALTKAGTLNGFVTIWVARGTYRPTTGIDRTVSFALRANTSLYGGFAGTETLLSDRAWNTNATILSGDLLQNDGDNFVNNSDNSYHVVTSANVNNTAVLDGFTIKGGNANGSGANDWGGGLFNEGASPTIANCRFEGNKAVNGGAIGNNISSAIITHCSFVANSASKGGGIYNTLSSPTIANCLFRNNNADNAGGALFNEATSSPLVTNCTFSKNKSWNEGGGIYNTGEFSKPTITNSILWENIMRRDGDTPNQITNSSSAAPVVRYSLVQGGYSGGTNIVNQNPLFVDATTGDLHLQACSPAINAGTNADLPSGLTTDLDGTPRILPLNTGTVDMGVYESQSPGCCPSGNVLYVKLDATGMNNGTSWTDAFTSLQDALAQASICPTVNQVWVARGTYYPDKGRHVSEDDRAATFMLKDAVAVYGGFAGSETSLSQRAWQTNVTTLSGEIQNNASIADNSYHVVTGISLGNTTMLDGFTITGGNASGNSNLTDPYAQMVDVFGGGLFSNASSPVISNCTFSGNMGNGFGANMGGALFNYNGSSPTITHCTFSGNTGIAVLNGFGYPGASFPPGVPNAPCSPTITYCSFTGNTGGGIGNLYSSATITGCTFSQNGVGISNGYSSVTISNCSFSGHTSGAIMNMSSSAIITGCTFSGNSFTNSQMAGGGAITNAPANTNDPSSSATLANCSFTNNTAVSMGGAIVNNNSSATLANCRFSGNSAQMGGAIASAGTSTLSALTLTNCTFYGNTATAAGGAILKGSLVIPIPLPFPIPGANDASTLTIKNSILWSNAAPQGPQIYTGSPVVPVITYSLVQDGATDNHNLNTDPQFVDATNGNLHLLAGSPAIDTGNNDDVPPGITTDLEGSPRIYNSRVDMGAYEYLPCGAGGIVYVKQDATGLNDGTSWTHAFTSMQDALTRANYCAGVTQIWVAKGTYVPDATGSNRSASFVLRNNLAIYGGFAGTETELTARNMKLNETILSGEIQNNASNTDNSYHVVRSMNLGHSAVLDGFTIKDGAANGSAAPDNGGGGIYSSSSQAVIINCRLIQNTAQYGGAIYIDGAYTHFINCSFSQNTATGQGGAIYNGTAPSSSVLNCSFSGNTAPEGGGIYSAAPIYTISNSILWGNSGGEVVTAAGQTTAIFYSVVQGGATDNNNLNTDPLFMNAAAGDLRLQGCSPAINAGNHDANVFTTDADGNPRKVSIIDMGAYEFQPSSGVGIVYVKGNATGHDDGTSWANAFTHLQDALARATSCGGYQVQVWVAKGVYYPDEGKVQDNNSRSATFSLKNNIAILGGFAGTESDATGRNPQANETILSGDIDGDGTLAGNAYHVVTAAAVDNTAILSDVTITGGNANSPSVPDNQGGGLYVSTCNPSIYHCTFRGNNATSGGGAYISTSATSMTLFRCTFSQNTATEGGALYNAVSSQADFLDCSFRENTASQGGAIHNHASRPITNSLFWENTATAGNGGAIYQSGSGAALINCSFSSNTASGAGGALYNNSSSITITNTVLWGNTPDQVANSTSTPTITYSLVQDGPTDNHNLNADPLFVDATTTGNLHLKPCSPAVDAGNNTANTRYEDLDNGTRVLNSIIDLGAYESPANQCCPAGGVLYVKQGAAGKNNGTSWTDAYTSLQEALAQTSHCANVTQIWVAAGTYYPDEYNRETSFVLKNNLALYGGFAGTEQTLEQRDWKANVTILSGDVDGDQTSANNSYHVVRSTSLNSTAVLDGFTITGGNANGPFQMKQDQGAGMYNDNASSPTIANCTFTSNWADRFGGAMYNDHSSPTITHCSFSGNRADVYQGGGIYNYMSSPTITFSSFSQNTAGSYGGAIYNATGAASLISNCRFTQNTGSDGGAIGNFGSGPTIKNSLFISNTATHTGGALFNYSAAPNVFNCSFYGNTASEGGGGGIYNMPQSTPVITNCILWGNGSEIVSSNATPVVSYSIVQNGGTDNHNLAGEPLFKDAAGGDLRLLPGSPAIDAGNNLVVSDGDHDLDDTTRIVNSRVDIGAYEVQGVPITLTPPADFTLPNNAGNCSAVVSFTDEHAATTTGGTGTVTITYDPVSGSELPVGENTVTATASDEAGQTATATFTVTVEDKEGPTFTAPDAQEMVINESCQVVVPDLTTGLNGSDNCGGVPTFTQNHAQGDILPAIHGRAFTVNITATDAHGNTTTHPVTLTAVDKTAPVPDAATLADITGECSAGVTAPPTATDPCSGSIIIATTPDPLSYSSPGVHTIHWTYDDGHGNTATQIQNVVILDVTPPTIAAPGPVNTNTNSGCTAVGIALGTPTVDDNCTPAGSLLVEAFVEGTKITPSTYPFPLGQTTLTWKVSDDAGLSATATQVVTVADNELPVISCPDNISVNTASDRCDAVVDLAASATDNCGTPAITYTIAGKPVSSPVTLPVGATLVTATATDAAGNTATCSFTVTVVDNTPPTFTAPANATIFTGPDCNYEASPAVTGDVTNEADNCSTGLQATYSDKVAEGTCAGNKTILRTWTLTDQSGNSALPQAQTITVKDNTPPTFTAPANVTIYTTATCTYDVSVAKTGDVTNEADNCSVGLQATYNDVITEEKCTGSKVITRTWQLKDACNNLAPDQVQIITVLDNTPPTFTRPPDITIYTTATCTYDASVAKTGDVTNEKDNCSTGLQATYSDVVKDGTCTGSKYITRTWHLVDDCGNVAKDQVQTITVMDKIPPTFTAPKAITINTGPNCTYDASPAITGTMTIMADNCDKALKPTYTDVVTDGNCPGKKLITRTWQLKDACANKAPDQVQLITVLDNTPPTYTRPADITIYADAACQYNADPSVTGDVVDEKDNCSVGLQATYMDVVTEGNCTGKKVITRTWHLKDFCSNLAPDQKQIITVVDNTPPTFTRPADITITTDAACQYNADPSVTGDVTNEADNCSTGLQANHSDVVSDGSCAGETIITRTWTLVDACGNAAPGQVQTITVQDKQAPMFTRPADITIYTDAACTYNASPAVTGDVTNEADNCSVGLQATYSDVVTDGLCAGSKTITRTWTLVDGCGNTTTQTQTITVEDKTPPDAKCKNIDVYLGTDGTVSIIAADVDAGSTDACSTKVSLSIDKTEFTTANVGPNTVTLTATDDCKNSSSCTATVTVMKRPVIITYSGDFEEQYSDQQALTATLVDGISKDPLGGRTLTFTIGSQSATAETNANGVATATLVLTQDPALTYQLQIQSAEEAIYKAGFYSHFFDITSEDAVVTYTGSLFVSTSGINSSLATLTLSATIQDIGDGFAGDIRKARVRFINRDNNTYIGDWLTPGLVSEGDLSTGTVTYNWSVNIGQADGVQYTIGIVVDNGYYLRNNSDDDAVVSVAKPLADFVSGGGYLILQTPSGLKAGDAGSKNNFGFNVRYNKSIRNLQGSINTIVRRTESDGLHVYQIKGNAMTSLAINGTLATAIFDGKASIQDITNPLLPVSVDGNASLHVEMTDRGEPGNTDGIAITVWNKSGGLWFASNWNGVRTIEQGLDAGNLKVSAGGTTPPPPVDTKATTTTLSSSQNPSAPNQAVLFTATVTPKVGSGIPTGKITFYDDGIALRTVSLVNGTATYSTSKLPIGQHAITAVYSGDRNFSASTSPVLTQTVQALVGAPPGANPKGGQPSPSTLQLVAYPNPAPYSFTLEIGSSSDQAVSLRVTDMSGRIIEARNHIAPNSVLAIGENYRPGTYLAEVQQGTNRAHVLLIKQSD